MNPGTGAAMKEEIEARKARQDFLSAYSDVTKGPDLGSPDHVEAARIAKLIVPKLVESFLRAQKVSMVFDQHQVDVLMLAVKYHLKAAMIKAGIQDDTRRQLDSVISPLVHMIDLFDPANDRSAKIVLGMFLVALDNLGTFLGYTKGDIREVQKDGTVESIVEDIFGPAVIARFPKKDG